MDVSGLVSVTPLTLAVHIFHLFALVAIPSLGWLLGSVYLPNQLTC